MIVCPNCNHQNPEGAHQCEACYTALPNMVSCPNCGASIQSDATFCGQCGYNLKPVNLTEEFPPLVPPTVAVNSPSASELSNSNEEELDVTAVPSLSKKPEVPSIEISLERDPLESLGISSQEPQSSKPPVPETPPVSPPPVPPISAPIPPTPEVKATSEPNNFSMSSATQLQTQKAKLLHLQTNSVIDLPQNLSLIHIGKQNNQIPPDIDVSGFPNSEIVSRVHADIRIEGDAYFLEDMGSSNGTYINHTPLLAGDRHRLRSGDRVALGKGDKMTFVFQLSS
jgi:pSer/pThr/pTyr-binding forkhead associated (FHA) protein/ribosomal protein L40E